MSRDRFAKAMGVVVCLLLVSALSGCTGSTPATEPTTIAFAYYDYPGDTGYYQELAQRFKERYPYITVELSPVTPGPFGLQEADVFEASLYSLTRLREQGDILSVAPFIDQDGSFDLSDFYPGLVEAFTDEGETWAIPAELQIDVMYYNKDLFDAQNVPYPEIGWTWEGFLNAALDIRDPDAYVFGFVSDDTFDMSLLFIYQHGGQILDDLQHPTRATFDDPLNIEAMAWYADLIHEHNVIPARQQMLDSAFGRTVQSGVYLGKAGMWFGPLYERGGVGEHWPTEWKFRWGMVPLPRDARAVTPVYVDGYAISSLTQHPDACWAWIAFLSEQMTQPRAIPPRQSLVESAEYEQLVGSDVAITVRAAMEDALLVPDIPEEFDEDLAFLLEAIQEIIAGTATAEEALPSAQRQAERQ